jgi:hypothetical protein
VRRAFVTVVLVALAVGCTDMSIDPAGTPHDAAAVIRPASMVADRAIVASGDVVELTFPDEMTRGVWFVLEREAASSWVYRYDLTSDGPGPGWPMEWHVAGDEGFAVEDVGVGGPGPDRVVIPDTAEAGSWRICTANAAENVCVRVEILAP